MKNFPLLFCFVLFFAFAVSAQTNQSLSCPKIDVSGGGITNPGEPTTFTANVEGYDLSKLSFKWTISTGEILQGQDTPTITVLQKEDNENLTATVEIKGLPEGCPATASETGAVCRCVKAILFDEYGKIFFSNEKAKLDNVAAQLLEDKNSSVYFIIYLTNKQKPAGIKTRQANIQKYLMETHKIPKDRITFILSDWKIYWTKIFIVLFGADAPQP